MIEIEGFSKGKVVEIPEKYGTIKAFTTVTWEYELLCKFPHNSAILEAMGLIMPFIEFPNIFAGKFVKYNVDNISLIFNWEKRTTKKD